MTQEQFNKKMISQYKKLKKLGVLTDTWWRSMEQMAAYCGMKPITLEDVETKGSTNK